MAELGPGTVSWVASHLGTEDLIVRGPLVGGAVALTWAVVVRGEENPRIVLKEFPRERWGWGDYSEEAAAGEAAVLALGLPKAPALVAVDAGAVECAEPTLAMEWVAGSVRLAPPGDLGEWLEPMADLLAAVHCTDFSSMQLARLPDRQLTFEVPAWTECPDDWRRLFDRLQAERPVRTDDVVLHSDFQPGNVLWTGDEITALLDWTWSCVGPAATDVAHCRTNLALLEGVQAADRFLELYRARRPGSDTEQWWYDAADALNFLPDPLDAWRWHEFGRPDLTRDQMRSRLEEFALGTAASP